MMTIFALFISQGRLKYEKVHTIYKRYIDIEDHDPTLVSKRLRKCLAYILDAAIPTRDSHCFSQYFLSYNILNLMETCSYASLEKMM